MRYIKSVSILRCQLLCGVLALGALLVVQLPRLSAQEESAWQGDWAIERGFSIATDTSGYQFPTSLTFDPNPGSAPQDPLYFVTEMRGTIKVVTNDRSVLTFAENLSPPPSQSAFGGEEGLTGLCLDPEHGYVFALVATAAAGSHYTNHVLRFTSTPNTFSTAPKRQEEIAPVVASVVAIHEHQIDSCVVDDGLLYVAVGDAGTQAGSQDISVPFGKILRMTVDGKPIVGNPAYDDGDASRISSYVWARGLRNPFAIKPIGGRLYVFDNGETIDRLLDIQPGENYFWDGIDRSIGANALTVVSPSFGPAQMDYFPAQGALFPADYGSTLFVASSATYLNKVPGILALPVDFETNHVNGTPRFFLQYRGTGVQYVDGLAFGPDGLYFTGVFPDSAGMNHVYKIAYDPEHSHPYTVGDDSSDLGLMNIKGCFNCHTLNGQGTGVGPVLDKSALVSNIETRLRTDAYQQLMSQLDASSDEPFLSYRSARQEVMAARSVDQVRLWMQYNLLEPSFDNPQTHMPNLRLTASEASRITDYLLRDSQSTGLRAFVMQLIPTLHYSYLALFFAGGLGVGVGLAALGALMLRRQRPARESQEIA